MRPHDWRKHSHHFKPPWRRNRRFIFWRFVIIFGGISILFLAAIGIVAYLVLHTPQPQLERPRLAVLIPFCAVPLGFMLVSFVLGGMAFRRLGTPFADIMSATDAIAQGDLSVRLRESIPGELGNLARRFNNMTAELERAEQQRRNLTADIAHELRTPLHIIQGNLEGMLDGVYEPSAENVTGILDETRLLARLVDDLQTLSTAEAGQLALHPTRFQIADLLNDLGDAFAAQAEEGGVGLHVNAPHQELALSADYDRLYQVLANLLANALRHTQSGGDVHIQVESDDSGLLFTVRDTGEGIPSEDLPFIFDRFWRGDRARTRDEASGSGLGLAIARGLVLAHGGTINVTSQPGEGTSFTIRLPQTDELS
jgi:signal transduction histidine kinase